MKTLLFFCLFTPFVNTIAQHVQFTTSQVPVKEGVIYAPPSRYGTCFGQVDGLYIYSAHDSCFAVDSGIVANCLGLDKDEYAVLVRSPHGFITAYSGFATISVVKGNYVVHGTFLGLLRKESDSYELYFNRCNAKGVSSTRSQQIDYLQQLSAGYCERLAL